MIEQQWLESADPRAMLAALLGNPPMHTIRGATRPSDRKMRLVACAYCRIAFGAAKVEGGPLLSLAALENGADGVPMEYLYVDLLKASEVRDGYNDRYRNEDVAHIPMPTRAAWNALDSIITLSNDFGVGFPDVPQFMRGIVRALVASTGECPDKRDIDEIHRRPQTELADALRGIVGNPWNPVAIDPAWLTPTVRAVAAAAYEERLPDGSIDPVTLAVLSDALIDAGCPETESGRTEKVTVRVTHFYSGGWLVLTRSVGDETTRRKANSRRQAIRYAEEKFRVKKWETQRNDRGRPNTEMDCWGEGVVETPDVPHPLLALLRSPGPHYRGMWSLDLLLGRG